MAREVLHLLDDIRSAVEGIENATAGKSLQDY